MKHTCKNGMIFINGVKKEKTYEEAQKTFDKFVEDYKKNPLPPGKAYNKYVRKWKRLYSELRNWHSPSNRIKRAGMKVEKSKYGYTFYGNSGLVAGIMEDACETVFWTTWFIKGTKEQEETISWEGCQFETKNDALIFLYSLDIDE